MSNDDVDGETGGHAHVFEASIGGKIFALKIVSGHHSACYFIRLIDVAIPQFKFYDDEEDRFGLIGGENEYVTVDLLRAHIDPFYNECRAYGRLIEANVNGRVAVRCYGYITLPAQREKEIEEKFGVVRWERPEKECAKPVSRRQPLRAIVKELVSEDLPFNAKMASKTFRDLKRMRQLGVYPIDIRGRNYKAGLLVDMSIAMTKPHYLFEIEPRWEVQFLQRQDLTSWESMMIEENVETWERAVRNPEYCKKLRSFRKIEDSDEDSGEGMDDGAES